MKEVAIIGAGITGLLCSAVFSKYRKIANVTVYEPGEVGGQFLTGGLRYIHRTPAMEDFLDENDMMWCTYRVRGGILLRGEVRQYPKFLRSLDKADSIRIQNDHYRKTRKMEPGDFGSHAMNDPSNGKSRDALRCDLHHLIEILKNKCNIVKCKLIKVISDKAYFENGMVRRFDYMILTIPLWVIKRIVDFELPFSTAMNLSVAHVDAIRDIYAKWDYVYTPYTPSDCVHRISSEGDGYAVEISGEFQEHNLQSDLNFLFKDGWCIKDFKKNLRGHLLPIDGEINTPRNIALVGRYASWQPRTTVDVVLNRATELGKRWFNGM